MIVLPAQCLPSVWEEVEALKPRQAQNRTQQSWRSRQQQFWWVNDITYSYDHDRKSLTVHVVGCGEPWQEVDPATGEIIDKHTQHVWLSSQHLGQHNVHERCNLGARQRWGIETSFQAEKRQGYSYGCRGRKKQLSRFLQFSGELNPGLTVTGYMAKKFFIINGLRSHYMYLDCRIFNSYVQEIWLHFIES